MTSTLGPTHQRLSWLNSQVVTSGLDPQLQLPHALSDLAQQAVKQLVWPRKLTDKTAIRFSKANLDDRDLMRSLVESAQASQAMLRLIIDRREVNIGEKLPAFLAVVLYKKHAIPLNAAALLALHALGSIDDTICALQENRAADTVGHLQEATRMVAAISMRRRELSAVKQTQAANGRIRGQQRKTEAELQMGEAVKIATRVIRKYLNIDKTKHSPNSVTLATFQLYVKAAKRAKHKPYSDRIYYDIVKQILIKLDYLVPKD